MDYIPWSSVKLPAWVQHLVLWRLPHVSIFKHQFVPFIKSVHLIFCIFASYKGPIVPKTRPLERERAREKTQCLLPDLQESTETYQRPEMTKIIVMKARCVRLFAWFTFASKLNIGLFFAQIEELQLDFSGNMCFWDRSPHRTCIYPGSQSHSWEVKLRLGYSTKLAFTVVYRVKSLISVLSIALIAFSS